MPITLDLDKITNKKTVDRREDTSPTAWRIVVFLARAGSGSVQKSLGHAYLSLLSFREDANTFSAESTFGLYPLQEADWILQEVPGAPDVLPSDAQPDIAMLVWTNRSQYEAVLGLRDLYKSQGTWQLLVNDCVSLMAKAAELLDLARPVMSLTPDGYVEELMKKND